MMQVGMIVGFFTAYPVNQWLVRHGWKEKMDHRTHLASMVEERRERLGDAVAEEGRRLQAGRA